MSTDKTGTVASTYDRVVEVDRYRAVYYAGASGDFNPIHFDEELARKMGLSSTILHGLCTKAFVINTVSEWIGDPSRIKKIRCRFSSPVYPRDTVVIRLKEKKIQDGTAQLLLDVRNNKGVAVFEDVVVEVAE